MMLTTTFLHDSSSVEKVCWTLRILFSSSEACIEKVLPTNLQHECVC